MQNDTIKSTLQKISALAEGSSSAGERQAATQKLNELLDKYGLSLADVLDREELCEYEFSYKDEHEKELLKHLFAKVRDTNTVEWLHYKSPRKKIGFELTRAEYAEMNTLYGLYRAALKSKMDLFVRAFMSKNDLFSTKSGDSVRKTMTDEDRQRIEKMLKMMSGMTRVDVPSSKLLIQAPQQV